MTGTILTVLSRCSTMDHAHRAIEWRAIMPIAAMPPLGTAMQASGAAQYLAQLTMQ